MTSAKVDDAFPLISLVMMVAPSPDWFTGVKDVDLRENGAWAQSKTRLFALPPKQSMRQGRKGQLWPV